MRQLQPCPKDRRKVAIPAELRDSLREAFEVIEEARRDPSAPPIDFDDAIQVGAVCGGRVGDKRRPYHFTYYPAGDEERGRWHLTLHATEVEDIGDGHLTELTLSCCTAPDCRAKFREADEHCIHCDDVDEPTAGDEGHEPGATLDRRW